MGKSSTSSSRRKKKKSFEDESSSSPSSSSSSSPSPSSSSIRESSDRRRRRRRKRSSRHRESSSSSKKRYSSSSSKKSSSSRKRDATRDDEKRPKRRKHRSDDDDESRSESDEPETLALSILEKFPEIATDLEQLLQMIDNGQGVDVRGLSDKSLVKNLERLFVSLKLKQNESGVFLLPPLGHRTLDVIGPILGSHLKSRNNYLSNSGSSIRGQSSLSDPECGKVNTDAARMAESVGKDEPPTPPRRRHGHDCRAPTRTRGVRHDNCSKFILRKRLYGHACRVQECRAHHFFCWEKCPTYHSLNRCSCLEGGVIGPEMPSRELLAAAAELTEAETLLREAEMGGDNDLLIGPPPPAVVAEAESANEAERFEEVARIADAEAEKPYDVLGVNWKMSSDNIKKRYWKLSLLVHPDKCSHPQAQEAFVKLNQAFKDLQDPTKREAIDEKIKLKEQQEQFKAELQQLREAAQWRRLQGISMDGDEELLAVEKEPPKRDEWMTTLPPERKPGVTTQSTRAFSRTTKEGRGDTSGWTDSPLDKAQQAKQNYLEAYDRAKALVDTEERKKSSDADLVDKYNSSRRSISLVQKHQEESKKQVKKKSKKTEKKEREKEEWVGEHPWKPWDREKDLTAGRQKVNLDSKGMTEGLSSRFSSGTVQRNFL